MPIEMRKLWPAGLALAVAIAASTLGYSQLRAQRFSNLELTESGLPSTYLVLSKTDQNRCFVLNRRNATIRRSDSNQPGRKWECLRLHSRLGSSGGDTWLLRSKRVGKGTVFLVPVMDVSDWTYPFLYNFVRDHGHVDLPEIFWTQVYVSRIYQGLYLRITLPFDRRKKDGGSGLLRELLTVRDGVLTVFDTRFRVARSLYMDAVANGVLPQLRDPAAALAWLAARAPTPDTTFLMSNLEPHALTLLPLPVSLRELYALEKGAPAPTFTDRRYERWTHGSWRTNAANTSPFSDSEWDQLRSGFEQYREQLRSALVAQATFELRREQLEPTISQRQMAVADLQLRLAR